MYSSFLRYNYVRRTVSNHGISGLTKCINNKQCIAAGYVCFYILLVSARFFYIVPIRSVGRYGYTLEVKSSRSTILYNNFVASGVRISDSLEIEIENSLEAKPTHRLKKRKQNTDRNKLSLLNSLIAHWNKCML